MKRLLMAGLLGIGLAQADCIDGFRKPTPAEEKMFKEVAAAFTAALPAAPESWRISSGSATPRLADPCASERPGSITVSTFVLYRYVNPPKAREYPEAAEIKKLGSEIEALERTPDDVRKRINEVQAQQSEKRRASRAADTAGNKAEASRLWKEADEIAKGVDKIRGEYLATVAPQLNERRARMKDLQSRIPEYNTEVLVSLTANEHQKMPAAGIGLNEEIHIWGAKTPATNNAVVQHVILKVKGWPDYRATILARIDQSKLSGLVK